VKQRILFNLLQVLVVLVFAPLVAGVLNRLKEIKQSKRGPSVLQPYRDLWKLFHKDEVVSAESSWVFRGVGAAELRRTERPGFSHTAGPFSRRFSRMRSRCRLPIALALVLATSACATTTVHSPSSAAAPPPSGDGKQLAERLARKLSRTPGEDQTALSTLVAVLWQQTAAEHRAACLEVYGLASKMLEDGLADPTWSALPEPENEAGRGKSPAIVIDVDETIFDNSGHAAREILWQRSFNKTDWGLWESEQAAAILPGAGEFLRLAAARGVEVYYVTNTAAKLVPYIERKLQDERLPFVPGHVMGVDAARGWTSDKTGRRREVAHDHRVLLLVGDDLGDFVSIGGLDRAGRDRAVAEHASWWGSRWILVPNPAYGSWLRALDTEPAEAPAKAHVLRLLEALDPRLPAAPAESLPH
jgi:5'-nucleotidase (lipoprotein e(P4) family)